MPVRRSEALHRAVAVERSVAMGLKGSPSASGTVLEPAGPQNRSGSAFGFRAAVITPMVAGSGSRPMVRAMTRVRIRVAAEG